MDEDFKVTSVRQFDDMQLLPDNKIREITRVRFFIGAHGPFERTYDRGVDASAIESDILSKQIELRRLTSL